MTQADKFKTLLTKAIANGYVAETGTFDNVDGTNADYITRMVFEPCCAEDGICLYHIIFNHDFARALFGDKVIHSVTRLEKYKKYELVLMQAVISDDPIDYMYKAVFGDVE